MDSDLSNKIKLALKAMLLVGRGSGERSAVLRVISTNPSLGAARLEGLKLLIETLNERDLLDRLVASVFGNGAAGLESSNTLRLAAHLLSPAKNLECFARIETVLRNLAPIEDLPQLELLIGVIQSIDRHSLSRGLTESEMLALETHHPPWWAEYCVRVFGRDEAIKLLSASPRPRYIRINPFKNQGRTTLPDKLKRLSSTLDRIASGPSVYALKSSPSNFAEFFSEGVLQMQDLASFLAIKAADAKPGEKVLDLCAAPGGKTAALAQFMKNRGRIISVDYSRSRMQGWKREVRRLGVKIAEPIVCTAESLSLREKFDLIVVDPPCTGTGILDRNPSMKWRLSPDLIDRYSGLQRRFLHSASQYLTENGRILYCTCSVTLEENEHIVQSFLKLHSEFETDPILPGYGTVGMEGLSDCRRLWPHRDGTAGYFVARLQRVN